MEHTIEETVKILNSQGIHLTYSAIYSRIKQGEIRTAHVQEFYIKQPTGKTSPVKMWVIPAEELPGIQEKPRGKPSSGKPKKFRKEIPQTPL